jgi:hypothetical protein
MSRITTICHFALKEIVAIHIVFMATSTHDARLNDWKAKFSVKHQLEIRTGKAKISESSGSDKFHAQVGHASTGL